MIKKSTISLISYDAHLLPRSIERYYDYVDEIILGLDKDRITWSNNPFSFEEGKLWENLNKIDGVETLKNIKNILEEDNYPTKIKMGYTYNRMNDITQRL